MSLINLKNQGHVSLLWSEIQRPRMFCFFLKAGTWSTFININILTNHFVKICREIFNAVSVTLLLQHPQKAQRWSMNLNQTKHVSTKRIRSNSCAPVYLRSKLQLWVFGGLILEQHECCCCCQSIWLWQQIQIICFLMLVDGCYTLVFTFGSQIRPLSLVPRVLVMNLCVTTFKQAGLDSLS